MIKKQVEIFLLDKRGYLKKGPLEVAKMMWKLSPNVLKPKNKQELSKELDLIRVVQSTLRQAVRTVHTDEETTILDTYEKIMTAKDRPKRKLFFDIETSPNITFSWRIGRDINLSHNDILQERAIICVSWKWSDKSTVQHLQWNKGDDKELLKKFAKIIDSADEVIGQNSDRFDIKWLRARCLFHRIPLSSKFNSIDTLKMAKAQLYLNCNKLDYLGEFMGLGKKIKTDYDLWKDIVLHNSKEAMDKMLLYCDQDVILLEKVYNRLQEYTPIKKFRYKI